MGPTLSKVIPQEEETDIVFQCNHCNINMVRNSREHDNCLTTDGDHWYCEKCHIHCPNEEEEECEECEEGEYDEENKYQLEQVVVRLSIHNTCQVCNNTNPHETTSLCESCQLSICQQCESPYTNYIVCESCIHNLYSHDVTLIECEHCGNQWDGHAQCNCYYEEDDEV
jgi:hypothetical protein